MRIEDMTPEQWDEERRVQNQHLRDQLDALHRTRTWAKYRLLEVRCRRCGYIVAEVMGTKPYRVVRTWDAQTTKGEVTPWSRGMEYHAYRAATTRLVRRGEPMFHPIPNKWQPHLIGELFFTACRCRGWTLHGARLADALRDGTKKIILR